MLDVREGRLEVDKASVIQKIAAQVNENMYAEAKVAKLRADAGEALSGLGDLPLGERIGAQQHQGDAA
jgi:hypothetical protein